MKKNLHPGVMLLCIALLLSSFSSNAQAPVFNSITPNTTMPAKFDRFELNINLTASFTNAYDYSDIDVQCIFFAPSGRKDTVDGFYMQDYILKPDGSLTLSGSGTFKVRYAPNEAGNWSYILSCKNLAGTTTQASQNFQCIASSEAGFIRKNVTNYLNFDNGKQYIPIGENMGWQSSNIVIDYTDWLTKLANNDGNFIRVWMSSWAFALEWKNGNNDGFGGLEKYNQYSGFYLDWLLNYCKQKDVYMMLTLNNHGQVSTNVNPQWIDNPYNAANGGPAANTWDFFTDMSAKAIFKNRLRYIVARYGYSQNIQSWELFNEVDWTDQFSTRKSDVTIWHDEMSTYIKSKDVYKHLVTTSYAYDYNDPATWNLPNIDFTQTHFYSNSPNIESVLSAATQNYLINYQKPTLNGEFGLGPPGPTLSANDPNGIHIHNAIWGSSFSGAMGSAMSWWWDDYINPQNLYYHFKPLAAVTSLVKFKDDDYKKATTSIAGGGASDVIISPGGSFFAANSSSFIIDANGNMTPGPNQLGQYLFGSVYNTAYHNPPSFTVTYPIAGQFRVATGNATGASPQINIYVDGASVLNQAAAINSTYAVNIAAGTHIIKVDNLGTDWVSISNYTFVKAGPPLTSYVVKSADTYKAAGWVLNSKYNWQYLQANGSAPPIISGSNLSITGMHNGSYVIKYYSPATGAQLSTATASVFSGTLSLPLPNIAWDVAFTAVETSTLPVRLISFKGYSRTGKNYLNIDIANAVNIGSIFIERSAGGTSFDTLSNLSLAWSSIQGKHQYIDQEPLKGNNFYRLKIIDNDGLHSYSAIVKLVNDLVKISVHPNPANENIFFNTGNGLYVAKIVDESGKTVLSKTINGSNSSVAKMPVSKLATGIYYLIVQHSNGARVGYEKFAVMH
ncbi:MAG: DUF5060 domain-containing protein [Bacteroidota bacterium]|nr:DUF5060 domain-containing protein [Bacteroidota bacterium]